MRLPCSVQNSKRIPGLQTRIIDERDFARLESEKNISDWMYCADV